MINHLVRSGLSVLFGLLMAGRCEAQQPTMSRAAAKVADKQKELHMWMTVGEHHFGITLADNEAARAFATLLPLTLDMADLNSNEKHVRLPKALPQNVYRPGTIQNGDLMLYGADTLVVFYLTFNSAYSYTRLGQVDDPAGLAQALDRRSVRVVFSKE